MLLPLLCPTFPSCWWVGIMKGFDPSSMPFGWGICLIGVIILHMAYGQPFCVVLIWWKNCPCRKELDICPVQIPYYTPPPNKLLTTGAMVAIFLKKGQWMSTKFNYCLCTIGTTKLSLYRVVGCPLFRDCLSIKVDGRTVGTFGIVRYIVGVRCWGVSVKDGSIVDQYWPAWPPIWYNTTKTGCSAMSV